jgi:hypothetical protein
MLTQETRLSPIQEKTFDTLLSNTPSSGRSLELPRRLLYLVVRLVLSRGERNVHVDDLVLRAALGMWGVILMDPELHRPGWVPVARCVVSVLNLLRDQQAYGLLVEIG